MSSSTDPARRSATPRHRAGTDPRGHEFAAGTTTLDRPEHPLITLGDATEVGHHDDPSATRSTRPDHVSHTTT